MKRIKLLNGKIVEVEDKYLIEVLVNLGAQIIDEDFVRSNEAPRDDEQYSIEKKVLDHLVDTGIKLKSSYWYNEIYCAVFILEGEEYAWNNNTAMDKPVSVQFQGFVDYLNRIIVNNIECDDHRE